MNFQPLLDELATLLEVPVGALSAEARMDGFENWDSLTKVSLIGFVSDRYSLSLDGDLLERVQTVGELTAMLAQRATV
ncbi:MAG TPA: acyl carrier protein [Burkholderiaceae bacterium]|nr:acyl carrier protein [Burkholderiaceae bacterium]